jgi:hypothetical protein
MATTIVHFGVDECVRLLVLSGAGYSVDACGTSIAKFHERLLQGHTDAIAVSSEGLTLEESVASTARSLSKASLILFEGPHSHLERSQFDLVISPGTGPNEWLAMISELLERSRAIQKYSQALHAEAGALRQECARTREESALQRDRAKRLRVKIDKARNSDGKNRE